MQAVQAALILPAILGLQQNETETATAAQIHYEKRQGTAHLICSIWLMLLSDIANMLCLTATVWEGTKEKKGGKNLPSTDDAR